MTNETDNERFPINEIKGPAGETKYELVLVKGGNGVGRKYIIFSALGDAEFAQSVLNETPYEPASTIEGHCPWCQSANVLYGEPSSDEDGLICYPVECSDCGHTATEKYLLDYAGTFKTPGEEGVPSE